MLRGYRKNGIKSSEKRESVKEYCGLEVCTDGQVRIALNPDMLTEMIDITEAVKHLGQTAMLAVMTGVMESEVNRLAGDRYERRSERENYRWSNERGSVRCMGQKVGIERPRVRSKAGSEIPIKSYELFQSKDENANTVMERVLSGLSNRKYKRVVESVIDGYGIERSSISKSFIKATAKKLQELNERRLDGKNIIAILIDGIEFKGHLLIVAVGIDETGRKEVIGLRAGATENSNLCISLLNDLIERGLDINAPRLFVIDGSKALSKAIKKVFGEIALIQRCQIHKRRNVKSHLPEKYHVELEKRLRVAYGMKAYSEAKELLEKTVNWLSGISASAADSLCEGLEETLTLHKLNVPPVLRKSLSSTNIIESAFSAVREMTRRVKRWMSEMQVCRWCAAGLLEVERQFHKISGHRSLPVLVMALKSYHENMQNCVDKQLKVG